MIYDGGKGEFSRPLFRGVTAINCFFRFFFIVFFSILTANAIDITVHNKTDMAMNLRFYYYHPVDKGSVVQVASDQFGLGEHAKQKKSRPDKKLRKKFPWPFYYDRYLVVSQGNLPDSINALEWEQYAKVAVGDVDTALALFSFYIIETARGSIQLVTLPSYLMRPARKAADFLRNAAFDKVREVVAKSPYAQRSVSIRRGDDLADQEKIFIEKRLTSVVVPAIKKMCGSSIDGTITIGNAPRIAFCFSGGGFRAMIATMGWMLGAQETGLLDCVTYTSALSGSTWFLFPWVYLGAQSIENFRERVVKITDVPFPNPLTPVDIENIVKYAFLIKMLCQQNISSVDFYGALLANKLFFDLPSAKRQGILISDFEKRINDARCPLPIGTVVEASSLGDYRWLEVTPYEVGGQFLQGYVPSWAFGGIFKNGSLKKGTTLGGLHIGYLMGIFGSAYCANFKEIIEEKKNAISVSFIKDILRESLQDTPVGKNRAWPAMVRNPSYKAEGMPFSRKKNLKLVDAGLAFNLPVPPLMRSVRKVDIIIIGDASAGLDSGAGELRKVIEYMKAHNIKFPDIDLTDVHKKPINIFKSSGPSIPVIVYMPLCPNSGYSSFDVFEATKDGYCGTFNFHYTRDQVHELSGLAQYNMKSSIDQIRQVICDVIRVKKTSK